MLSYANRKTVAKQAGVSESTVSRALNNSPLIPEQTKIRVCKVAEKVGYTPNRQASLLAKSKTFRIGFVIPSYKSFPTFSRPFFPALLDGVVLGAEKLGYSVEIVIETKDGKLKDLSKKVKGREIDGILLAVSKTDDPRIEKLKTDKIPFVLINNSTKGVNCVDNNPISGMESAFKHIHKMGHKNIGYISGDTSYTNAIDRLNTFKKLTSKYKFNQTIIKGNFSKTSGYFCTGKLLHNKKNISVILTSCDREAIGVLEYCKDHGIKVPSDISVIGFDNLESVDLNAIKLTTINNPIMKIGKASSELLINLIENKVKGTKKIKLETEFILRDSCGKAKL